MLAPSIRVFILRPEAGALSALCPRLTLPPPLPPSPPPPTPRLVATWLVHVASPPGAPNVMSSSSMGLPLPLPLPSPTPQAFSCLPEYFMEDVAWVLKLVTEKQPQV